MKVGDKVWDRSLCKSGTILKEPYYRVAELYKEELDDCIQVMSLRCTVDIEGMGAVVCSLEDLALYETPQVVEYQLVQISMHARMYWGLTGTVVELVDYGALVKLDGYARPIKFKLDDIEPLSEGSLLLGWLDSLLPVKEY